MKFCSHCGSEVADDAVVCPKCGCQVGEMKVTTPNSAPSESRAPQVLGILSVVFGALGGWLGLLFGIIGLAVDKDKKYKNLNITGMCLFGAWLIIWIIVFATTGR
jgi:hypothetical protein